jgi:uncharacterized protein (DUF1778 family)
MGDQMRFSEAMDDLVQVRVAREEKRLMVRAARRCGMTLSEYVRQITTEAAQRVSA